MPMMDDAIQLVATACGCDPGRAKTLLRLKNNDVEAAISYFDKTFKSRRPNPLRNEYPSSTSSNVTSLKKTPPAIVLPLNPKSVPLSNRPQSLGSSRAPPSPLLPRLTSELGSTNNSLNPLNDIGAFLSGSSTPSIQELVTSGLEVNIPTTRLVSRPTSPTPSLPSRIDTDSSASSKILDHEGSQKLSSPSMGEHALVEQDSELGRDEEAKSAEKKREREELRRLEQARESHQCWNFLLPSLPFISMLPRPSDPDEEWDFNISRLINAVQHGEKEDQVRDYLQKCSTHGSININQTVQNFPPMFYAVETNDKKLVQAFALYGGDVNCFATYQDCHRIPLLAFAIINSLRLDQPTTPMVATLLSLGATAEVIPKAFYDPFSEDLPVNGPRKEKLSDLNDPQRSWCESKETRKTLAKALDLTQRYYLQKSTMIPKPRQRHRQVTKLRNAEPLWEVPYLLIGQIAASLMVVERMVTNLVIQSKKPMVLVFAGPSGHGKTELARKLEYVLSLQMEIIDCTTFSSESGLFGPRTGIVGNEKGSRLNNFLASKHGQSALVFMDEFEKTSHSVHNALLVPFDYGEYEDRRNGNIVDCSKIIWILATNAIDRTIMDFWEKNEKVLQPEYPDETEKRRLLNELSKEIQSTFKDRFDPPLTGRVTAFVPFLPFALGEQAVGAHKYLLDFVERARKRVVIQPASGERMQLLGNVRLRIPRDASLCAHLVQSHYHKELGIRSLKNGVGLVENEVVKAYLDADKNIEETSDVTEYTVDLVENEVTVTRA